MISVSGFEARPTESGPPPPAHRLRPAEVEAILEAHPAIAEVCGGSRPEARTGAAVTAPGIPRREAAEAGTVAWPRASVWAHPCPTRVRFAGARPRPPSGEGRWREARAALDRQETPA